MSRLHRATSKMGIVTISCRSATSRSKRKLLSACIAYSRFSSQILMGGRRSATNSVKSVTKQTKIRSFHKVQIDNQEFRINNDFTQKVRTAGMFLGDSRLQNGSMQLEKHHKRHCLCLLFCNHKCQSSTKHSQTHNLSQKINTIYTEMHNMKMS